MPTSLSAQKRNHQNEVRRDRNRARKSQVKTLIRKFTDAIRAGDVDQARTELQATVKKLDQVAAAGTVHKNAAARTKSRLAKRLNKLAAGK
ncbi:MAG: 30S ribosomal protein S20 [Phycisphaerae bacterium]